MPQPLVSAIVLCYNQAKYVVECLEGVKAQDYPNLELIINDDASRDDSAIVIEAWLKRNSIPHRFLRSPTNQGLCRSLNHAIRYSRGKYISGIAADDVWLPGKLRAQVELLERLPARVGVVYSNALQVDESGDPLPQRFIESQRQFAVMPEGNIHQALWGGNYIPAMTTLVKRACYDQVGLFDEALFYEDWDMWLRISRGFDFAYLDEVTAKYRIVSTSMVQSQPNRVRDAVCQVCWKHLRAGTVNVGTRSAAAHLFYRFAISCYEHKTPRHKRHLVRALRFRPTPGLALRCLCALVGVGPESFARVRRALGVRTSGEGGVGTTAETLPSF